jgi:hypothetical protein
MFSSAGRSTRNEYGMRRVTPAPLSSTKPVFSPVPAFAATRTITGTAASPPGLIVICCGTSISTPPVWVCGATVTDQVPAPSPASLASTSIDLTWAPWVTSIRANESD